MNNKNDIEPRERVNLYIKELRDMVLSASFNYDIWWVYKEKDSREQYIEILNNYLLFFRTSIHAHFVAFVVALYMLYEDREDTYNFHSFIKLLSKENILDSAKLESIRQKLISIEPLWKKIAILRLKIFAHRDNQYRVEELFDIAKVTPNEIKQLIDSMKEIINNITIEIDNSTFFFDSSKVSDDIKDLLDDLKRIQKLDLEKLESGNV